MTMADACLLSAESNLKCTDVCQSLLSDRRAGWHPLAHASSGGHGCFHDTSSFLVMVACRTAVNSRPSIQPAHWIGRWLLQGACLGTCSEGAQEAPQAFDHLELRVTD